MAFYFHILTAMHGQTHIKFLCLLLSECTSSHDVTEKRYGNATVCVMDPSFSKVLDPYVMRIYWKQNSRNQVNTDVLLHSHKTDILSKAKSNFPMFINNFFPVLSI